MQSLFRLWGISILLGALSAGAFAQRYVISAKPGAVNYLSGDAYLNGQAISEQQIGKKFLNPNDLVSTGNGKAEILLTPGVFLRIGDHSEVQMMSLELTNVQVGVKRGEAMLEVDELTKDNQIQIFSGDASTLIEQPGLYRFTAGTEPTVGVIAGKASVSYKGQNVRLGKGHEALLAQSLEKRKLDTKKEDDLYAWSNARSEYVSAASYQAAQGVWQSAGVPTGWGGYLGGYGLGAWGLSGWFWNPMFSSWAWLPGSDLAFFSPFGYGFFAPAVIPYAPVAYAYTGGTRWNGPYRGGHTWTPIAVDPAHPPARGALPRSVAQQQAASAAALRSFVTGFRTASGAYVPAGAQIVSHSSGAGIYSRSSFSSRGMHPVFIGNGGHVVSWSRGMTPVAMHSAGFSGRSAPFGGAGAGGSMAAPMAGRAAGGAGSGFGRAAGGAGGRASR